MSRRIARLIPYYGYGPDRVFRADDAPDDIEVRRRSGFERLAARIAERSPLSIALTDEIEDGLSDLQFTNSYRVPFQFREFVRERLKCGAIVDRSAGVRVRNIDNNWSYDLSGSYGVNVFGHDFYKECMEEGLEMTRDLGPVLGPCHPVIADNVSRLKNISGLDEISFHMSGTEAVMQAVRLARYHTRRSHLVRFCGAYHGWWDGVQPGVGNQRKTNDVYTLKDMDKDTLRVLRTRKDIACILINPLQAMHPNADASSDGMLIGANRHAAFDREAYAGWLKTLREICTERGIVLIFDEVFVGFRLAYGGAQEYFGVNADVVTYGKTLGGGLPVGVVCGKKGLMKRYREERPADVCFARGTFNSHPLVMATMNAFLRRIEQPEFRESYNGMQTVWDRRAKQLNDRLAAENFPVRVVNLGSIWTVLYTLPGRYHWMFQYYLRAEGLHLSWTGTGRFIFSHNYSDADFNEVCERFMEAAAAMQADGWWWQGPELSDKSIKRSVLREILAARFGRLPD